VKEIAFARIDGNPLPCYHAPMTEYGPFFKKKSPPQLEDEPMYPESKYIRQELIEAVFQRRREMYRKLYQRMNNDHED